MNLLNMMALDNKTFIAIAIAAVVVLVLVIVGIVAGAKGKKKKAGKAVESPVAEATDVKEDKKSKKEDKEAEKTPVVVAEEVKEEIVKEETPVEEPAPVVEEAPVEEAKEEATVVEEAPVEEAKEEATVVEEAPVEEVKEEAPVVEEAPVEEVKEEAPVVEEAPVEEVKEEAAVVEEAPVVKEAPKKEKKAPAKKAAPKKEEVPVVEEVKEEAPVKEEAAPVEEPVSAPVKEEAAPAKKPAAKRAVGKWQVKQKSDNEYVAYLYANNGSTMLTSETYASLKGCLGGIETIKKNVKDGNFEIYRDKKGNYYYKLKSQANRLLCVGEIYSNKAACQSAVESVYNFAINAKLIEDVDIDKTIITWKPEAEVEASKVPGKWTIEEIDGEYQACLYASNGALLVSGELYGSVLSAKNSLDNIKKNALAYRFIIDRDKFGNYYFKLRNAQKSVLCVGETYPNQAGCESAIESVIRFCKNAELVEA